MKAKLIFSLAAGALLASCSTSTLKQDELKKVHRVAIVGLDIQQQKAISSGDLFAAATRSSEDSKASPQIGKESAHVSAVYQDLGQRLQKATGWEVLPLEKLRVAAAYKEFYREKSEGFQNRPLINDRFVLFKPEGVLDSFSILTSTPERLAKLSKDLGVDAIVYAPIQVGLNNNSMLASMVGKGEFKPSANLSLIVVDARTGEKIFSESVTGPKVKDGVKNTMGMAADEKLNDLAREASALSFNEVVPKLSVAR